MFSEIKNFGKWLRRKSQHTSTHRHYTSDLKLFFAWAGKSPAEITISDVDQYIAHAQEHGRAIATINRRVAALSAFYQFLQVNASTAPGQSGHSPTAFHPPGTPLTPRCG